MFKRLLLSVSALAAALCLAPAASADTWPEARPLTLIVPFSPGGNVDTTARLVAQKLADRLKQSVIVDNLAGAGGVLGVAKAAHAKPDGYTLVMGFDGPISVAKLINSAVKYDAETDLMPVALVTTAPVVLLARPGLPVKNMDELIALAREKPDTLTYASSGVGTVLHLAMEVMQDQAKVKLVHVPYRGGAQITNDVMGGQVDLGLLVTTSATPLVQQKKLQALGVTSAARVATLPDVQAFGETPALKGFELNTWTGVFAPAGTDPAIVQRLNQELNAVLQLHDVQKRLAEGGAMPGQGTLQDFAAFLKKEKDLYAHIVKSANIQQE
ncbi:Bug family tripartite tricarboxylate transporter substrate binding protein [Achromobacter anxifer]|uniref:Bug family tripartite tricarboxylate transporter substrate binding protein n=1 Tax=Achromobacter anxifer TaxID=1287737 RepID=UPI0023FA42C3|nr:tripartite tricarboxylate transporter substrate binding protein [Achromobacter anxifer]MDF8365683.1 tripartite tricarboxylate transporter substrate binding protein [Achromobacter anxifer]